MKLTSVQKGSFFKLEDHETLAVTKPSGGPMASSKSNMGKLHRELVGRFNDAGLDVLYETSAAFYRHCNNIYYQRETQIEAAVTAGVLARVDVQRNLTRSERAHQPGPRWSRWSGPFRPSRVRPLHWIG